MIDREQLLDIIRGRRQDWFATITRWVLSALTPIYGLAIALRNRRFDRAARTGSSCLIQSVSVPVISVGNLTTGGTGKTPMVIYLCQWLLDHHKKVAIVSRGYGAQGLALNDEAMELQVRLPQVPHLQSPDRFQAAQQAIANFGSQVIVLDDGFQHRRLHRDLDIVLIDCTNPFGYGHLLPRGLLREPPSSLGRCQAIVLTRCELVSLEQRERLRQQLQTWNCNAILAGSESVPSGWLQAGGNRVSLEHLDRQPVFVMCGIGNPQNFLASVQRLGLNVSGFQFFADHHRFTTTDLKQVADAAHRSGAKAILCTHKDLVKVDSQNLEGLPAYGLLIDTQFVFGQSELERLVLEVAHRTILCVASA